MLLGHILKKKILGHLFPGIHSTQISHSGTQRSLQLWSKGTWLLLPLTEEFDGTHVILVLLGLESESCEIRETHMQITKKGLREQTRSSSEGCVWNLVNETRDTAETPGIWNVRSIEYLPRKVVGFELIQYKRHAVCAENFTNIGVVLLKPSGAHNLLPCSLSVRNGVVGLNACSPQFHYIWGTTLFFSPY